jgi:hypothetical protein
MPARFIDFNFHARHAFNKMLRYGFINVRSPPPPLSRETHHQTDNEQHFLPSPSMFVY